MLHTTNPIIKHKTGLLNLAEELGNVSQTCRVMGVSRDTFYRYQEAVDNGGIDSLLNANRRVANMKNRVDEPTETAVVKYATAFPARGQTRASNELRKTGIFVSPSGIRSIWLRHDLTCFKDRLRALEDQANGEIETFHPGYLGSQDTFYVGTLKGVGRIYQQTFVDTYA